MKVSPARAAAFDVLLRIEREAAFSSVLLPIYEGKLTVKDKGLCHELTLGVLRRKLYLDAIIDQLSSNRKLDAEVEIALQIGLFQLIFLDRVPPHSAINESVELVSRAKKTSAKSFVNALLRKFQREPVEPKYSDETERISIFTSHPRWLVERWIRQFGIEEAAALCEANNRTPPLVFRFINNDEKNTEHILSSESVQKSEFVPGGFRAAAMSKSLTDLAKGNRIYFQDEGSQLVAQAVIAEGGKRILDVCAAPGGKTTMIARDRETFVVAGDVRPSRVARLAENCAKHNASNVSIIQYDAEAALVFKDESFDVVFVDAPCTGTGTIRHNPEIRYSVAEKDFNELSGKQLHILKNASELTAPGGSLIYSTCSLETEENEAVCGKFLAENSDFEIAELNISERFRTSEGYARTFLHRDGMDGFFTAKFRKIAEARPSGRAILVQGKIPH